MRLTFFASLLSVVLTLSPTTPLYAKTPHVGEKCLKVGMIEKQVSFVLVCQTKNGHTIWVSKLTRLTSKSTANSTLTPAPTPTSTPAPTPTSTPAPTPTSTPAPTPSWQSIQVEIFSKIKTVSIPTSQSFTVHYSPTVDKVRAQTMIDSTERAIAYWNSIGFHYPHNLHMVFLTEKDQLWWEDYKNSHNTICANRCDDFFVPANSASYGGGVSPSNFGTSDFKEVTIQYYIGSEYPKDSVAQWALDVEGPHEYVHAIEYALSKNTFYQLPCWLIEGAARFYERAMYDQSLAPNAWASEPTQRKAEFQEFQRRIDALSIYKPSGSWGPDDYLKFVSDHYTTDTSDDSTCSKTLFGYKVGSLIMEKFYLDFGSSGFISILSNITASTNWANSFKSFAQTSEAEWLKEKAFPYVLSSVN